MPKNNLFIVIDSLYYDKTIGNDYHPATMPFLDKLRSEGITCTNMYSEAPYTEAALVSLLCGIDTLKNGSYIRKLYGKETIMETFRDNGYETFSNCVQPLVYPSYSYQGLTEEYYNICYEFETLWAYRLEFYSKEYKKNGLDDKTMKVIIDLINDNFITWINFLESLRDNKKITAFIYKYVDTTDVKENLKQVNDEYKKFNKNKSKYTKELLELGKEHPVFKIHTYNLSKKMTPENMLIESEVKSEFFDMVSAVVSGFEEAYEEFGYFCDGVVLEVNDRKLFNSLGISGNHNNGNIALKVGLWEQCSYSGYVQKILWTRGKSKLSPVAIVADEPDMLIEDEDNEILNMEDLGVLTAQGNKVRRVPLYEPKNLIILDAYPGEVIYFRYGGEAGVVPCFPDGRLLKEDAARDIMLGEYEF